MVRVISQPTPDPLPSQSIIFKSDSQCFRKPPSAIVIPLRAYVYFPLIKNVGLVPTYII